MPDDTMSRLIFALEMTAYNLGKAEARGVIPDSEAASVKADLAGRRQEVFDAIDALCGRAPAPEKR